MKPTNITQKNESPWSIAIGAIAFFASFLISACGDDSTVENITQVNQSGIEVISDVSKLPKCQKENEGEMVWVKGEIAPRKCSESKWYAVTEGSVAATCTTKELKDKSGVKIICGGDSIGVVLNGKDGAKGEKGDKGDPGAQGKQGVAGKTGATGAQGDKGDTGAAGVGCSMKKIDDLSVRVICGKDSTILYTGKSSDVTKQDSVVLDSEKIAISLDEVSGVTQKGPFLMGSKVLIREMEDGRTLTQTGNSFNGKILNDKGEFKINARMLVSQYVMLEATGYYRNEVTGQNSNSELTLFAITDVNDRSIVNINLLTHLEYERVIYLVTQKKMKVHAAKKQAQKEVFGLLNIDATDFSNSEDLNIAGASSEDGALLAFSLMFQGDRTVADLTSLLQTIANDMEKDGKWDDATTRMKIAEWSADADSSGRLSKIRQNVKNWSLSSTVPKFEQFVRNFWYKEYGLDSCTAKKVGTVKAASAGKQKGTKTRYICKDTDGLGDMRWVFASDFEKDTYGWKDSTDGALKNGTVTGKKYVFDKIGSLNGDKGWRLAVAVENTYGGCVDSLYSKIRSYRGTNEAGYYQCQKATHTWVLVNSNLMIDTQGWKDGDDGLSKWGDSIGVVSVTPGDRICYVYDTSAAYNGWRMGNYNDCSLDIGGCTNGRAGIMVKANDGRFYNCANNKWSNVGDVAPNVIGWACLDSNDGEMKLGLYNTDSYFVCDANSWRYASAQEELACKFDNFCSICTKKRYGSFEAKKDTQYVCDYYYDSFRDLVHWREANCAELKTKSLCTANDSSIVNCEVNDYICLDSKWRPVGSIFEYRLKDWNELKASYYTVEHFPKTVYGDDLIDLRDGNVYKTVIINGMHVMAENLRYTDSVASKNLNYGRIGCLKDTYSRGSRYSYNCDEPRNCEIGGVAYKWNAAMDLNIKWNSGRAESILSFPHQGICPKGWHIPKKKEWLDLLEWLKSQDIFVHLGQGMWREFSSDLWNDAVLWTAEETGDSRAYVWYWKSRSDYYDTFDSEDKYSMHLVRCIKD